jgi:hypothetical protein
LFLQVKLWVNIHDRKGSRCSGCGISRIPSGTPVEAERLIKEIVQQDSGNHLEIFQVLDK